ncbi:hypothetical protein DdX_19937 [Ditylenchus destructor]|uniref:Uncharacterized protein n=1 Tax=Ditylenchus destructor TaxID=166010 RepID=A0AAD4QWU9_9BILA|nr:hypothetical protein DdX_19937 [Ditylenchus destructor]
MVVDNEKSNRQKTAESKKQPGGRRKREPPGNKGKNADNPLVQGQPFWFKREETNESAEEAGAELVIDNDTIEKIGSGEIILNPKDVTPKKRFDPFASVEKLQQSNDYFYRDNLLYSTATSVLTAMSALQ